MDMTAFTTGTNRSELISVARRISLSRSWGVFFILVVLAGYLALAVPPVFAQSSCPAGVTPYALPSASDLACGLQLIPRHAVTSLPGGGKRTEYLLPSGEIISSTTPPPSFDAAAASPVELQEYGIPSEPAATSPEYPKWRAMIEKAFTVSNRRPNWRSQRPKATQRPARRPLWHDVPLEYQFEQL
jgi:hypothetical protein